METVAVHQFLKFFQDFIDLCQWNDWPSNDTTELQLNNAFIKCQHIEQCLDRFHRNGTLNEFLAILDRDADAHFKLCLSEPSKYLLKKIINSDVKIAQVDAALNIFMNIFSEDKLESYITDVILEAACKETLLKNIRTVLPTDKILKFKCEMLLSQINIDSKDSLHETLSHLDQDMVDVLVLCLCSKEPKFQHSVNIISSCFLDVLLSKNSRYKQFWKCLFNVNNEHLISMCVENSDLYTYICEGLIDCGKLIKENMSAEYFYIDFSYSELVSIMRTLLANEFLKDQFVCIINNHGMDTSFWQSFL